MVASFEVRGMQPGEIDLAVDWAAAEGWNPGLNDGPVFYATDPGGFLIGLLDREPIACISVVAYDDAFGFLGFYIVRPEFRGKGFGLQIWNEGMERMGERNVGLDGVLAQQGNYRKSGFTLAYSNVRFEGVSASAADRADTGIVALGPVHLPRIEEIDRRVFPAPRPEFLRRWLTMPESHALGIETDGALSGYGAIRKCRNGYKIGPLVADGSDAAETLFLGLTGRVETGAPVFLDVPAVNAPAVKLAESQGMKPVFETARMYNRGEPDIRLDQIYGVTTFELG